MPTARAKEILDRFWDRSIPVNIQNIAAQMGVVVRFVPQQALGEKDYSGKFKFDEKGVPTCIIRSTDSILRQRFTIAHELGHYVLQHGDSFRDNTKNFSLNNFDPKERDANHFSAEILMPKIAVDFCIQKKNIKTVSELAEIFQVSTTAMRFRLQNLGWL